MDTKRERLHAKVAELIQELNNANEVFGDDNAPIWIMYGDHRYELAKELLRQTGISAMSSSGYVIAEIPVCPTNTTQFARFLYLFQ